MQIPVLKLELEHMKHSLAMALSEYTLQLDETLQAAITAFCTSENLTRIVDNEANRLLDQIVREAVSDWFLHGGGRAVIKAEVERRLSENQTCTPLDGANHVT